MVMVICSYCPLATWVKNGKPSTVTSVERGRTSCLASAATTCVRSRSLATAAANRSVTTSTATRTTRMASSGKPRLRRRAWIGTATIRSPTLVRTMPLVMTLSAQDHTHHVTRGCGECECADRALHVPGEPHERCLTLQPPAGLGVAGAEIDHDRDERRDHAGQRPGE